MASILERLIRHPDYQRYLQTLSEGDRKSIESFAVNFCRFTDDIVENVVGELKDLKDTQEGVTDVKTETTGMK